MECSAKSRVRSTNGFRPRFARRLPPSATIRERIWGGFCAPVLAYFATTWQLGLAIPMLIGTVFGAVNFIVALLLAPETKGKELVPDLVVA